MLFYRETLIFPPKYYLIKKLSKLYIYGRKFITYCKANKVLNTFCDSITQRKQSLMIFLISVCVDIHTVPCCLSTALGFPGGSEVKASVCHVGDLGQIPGLGRFPGEGHGNPLQYSCLENPMDRGAWRATVHWVAKSWKQLSDFTFHSIPLHPLPAQRHVYCCVFKKQF